MSEKYWGESKFPLATDMIKEATESECPICDSVMVMRWRKSDMQPFFSCSRFHEDGCKGSRNWTGETGYTDLVWEDTLKKEGKIDTARTGQMNLGNVTPRSEDAKFWRKKFEEERAFVMQQLHDIKNDIVGQRRRIETLESYVKVVAPMKQEEDDIPF